MSALRAPAAAPLLLFDAVGKRYAGGLEALRELSFELGSGEMAFVTGHSGAGKSTLLRLVHGSERASRGAVLFEGRNIGQLKARELPYLRRRVGMVFQDHRLLLDRSLFDNVALPLLIAGVARAEVARRVRAALDRVGLLARERSSPALLSAGEQQRVGIVRAIVAQPPLLLADEPTGNLDPQLAEDIMRLFAQLPAQGTAVLVASHDLHLVRRMGKRVLVLEQGRLLDDFRPVGAA
jgi:cell division transport system ATP-binding protein